MAGVHRTSSKGNPVHLVYDRYLEMHGEEEWDQSLEEVKEQEASHVQSASSAAALVTILTAAVPVILNPSPSQPPAKCGSRCTKAGLELPPKGQTSVNTNLFI